MLLQPFSVIGRKTAGKLRTDHLGKAFGALALMDDLPSPGELHKRFERSMLSVEMLDEWRRCVAEDLLLRHACGLSVPPEWLMGFGGVSPFGNGIPLKECLGTQAACATFPLAGSVSAPEPGIGHVWLLKDFDHRDSCDGGNVVSSDMGFCFVTDCPRWGGRSWQLAAKMAEHALNANTGSGAFPQQNLLDWVFSGAVDEQGHLVHVDGIVSKSVFPLSGRRWLLPRENLVDPEFKAIRQRLRMIYTEASVSSAAALVSGHGTCQHDLDGDRIECDEMHALVGAAPEPIIAAFLLSTAERLTLWMTEKQLSRTSADTVCGVLRELLSGSQACPTLREIPSNSVAGGEKTLWEYLAKHPDKRVVINATGGNRLMFAAAQSMARLFDNIRLIYRNMNDAPHHFIEIVYRQDNPSEGILKCRPHRLADCFWDVLYSDNREDNLDAAGILARMRGDKP